MTWLLAIGGILSLLIALLQFADAARALSLDVLPAFPGGYQSDWVSAWSMLAMQLIAVIPFFGWAALVELLIRIWRELQAIRRAQSPA
jgi:hypothetical protein